jgi:outer membrane immunogenic protein
MRRFAIAAASVLSVAVLAGCAAQSPSAPPPTSAGLSATEGTVTFTGGAVAIGVGFQWGSGTLAYQGRDYPFRLDGLSVVDVGVSRVTGSGTVRNLRKLADFSGNYVSITAGAALAGGGSATSLRNQNGVVIDGITTAQGVRLTLAPGGVNITLSGQP